jgi:CheY-like chemotaxis protein
MNKVKVLFVDDEHSLLKTYSLLLESDTSIIETCASEFEAIERLKL